MATNSNTFFSNLFDISVKEQVALTLCNSASDNFFILSGPPSFDNLGGMSGVTNLYEIDNSSTTNNKNAQKLCPLLFTQSFNDIERRYPDPQLGSFGTNNLITAPSANTTTQKSISIGAAAYVTTTPWAMAKFTSTSYLIAQLQDTEGRKQRWNLLKRLYFWLLNNENYISSFTGNDAEYIGDEAENQRAVAPDICAPWGNFAKSDLYKVPFGLMVLVAAKDKSPISLRYYEGCLLQDVDGGINLRAGVGQPTAFSGTSSLTCTYTKVRTFNDTESTAIAGSGTGAGDSSLLQKLLNDFGKSLTV